MNNEGLISSNCPRCGSTDIYWDDDLSLYKCRSCVSNLMPNPSAKGFVITNSRICDKCRTPNNLENIYCSNCAQPLLQNCPDCERLIDVSARFCPLCGINIKKTKLLREEERHKLDIESHEIQLNTLQEKIDEKKKEIERVQADIASTNAASKRLYLLGPLFLSDKQDNLYRELGNPSPGCFVNVLFRLATTWFLSLFFEKIINQNTEKFYWFFINLGQDSFAILVLLFSFSLIHLIVAIINMIARVNNAQEVISRYKAKLMDLQKNIIEFEKQKDRAEERLSDAKMQYENFIK